MKRYLLYGISICLLLASLAGCVDKNPGPSASGENAKNISELSAHTGSRFSSYDPDREIYITGSGIYLDGKDVPPNIRLEIISKHEIDLDGVEVIIDTQFPYELMRFQIPITRATEWMVSQTDPTTVLPYYVYQAYRGVDFTNADASNAVLEDFKNLTAEDLPEFYAYVINVLFSEGTMPLEEPEIIDSIEVIVDGETYWPEFGQVRTFPSAMTHWGTIHGTYDQALFSANGMGSAATGQIQQLYNDGWGKANIIVVFEAEEDMTLTSLHSWDENLEGNEKLEIVDILVQQVSGTMGVMQYLWDGKSPIDLYAGDELTIEVVFREPRTDVLWGSYNFQICVDVDIDGELFYIVGYYYQIDLLMNYYELYAIVFDGVDMEPYYRNYYYATNYHESWRNDYVNGTANNP